MALTPVYEVAVFDTRIYSIVMKWYTCGQSKDSLKIFCCCLELFGVCCWIGLSDGIALYMSSHLKLYSPLWALQHLAYLLFWCSTRLVLYLVTKWPSVTNERVFIASITSARPVGLLLKLCAALFMSFLAWSSVASPRQYYSCVVVGSLFMRRRWVTDGHCIAVTGHYSCVVDGSLTDTVPLSLGYNFSIICARFFSTRGEVFEVQAWFLQSFCWGALG